MMRPLEPSKAWRRQVPGVRRPPLPILHATMTQQSCPRPVVMRPRSLGHGDACSPSPPAVVGPLTPNEWPLQWASLPTVED
jgi:hypothetical protein